MADDDIFVIPSNNVLPNLENYSNKFLTRPTLFLLDDCIGGANIDKTRESSLVRSDRDVVCISPKKS